MNGLLGDEFAVITLEVLIKSLISSQRPIPPWAVCMMSPVDLFLGAIKGLLSDPFFIVIAIRYEGMDGVKTTSPAGGSKKL